MSSSIVALAKKMTKPKTKTVKKTIAVPKTQIVKQPTFISKDKEEDNKQRDLSPIRPIPPLSNQQDEREKRWKPVKSARFAAVWLYGWHSDWLA